MKSFTTPVLGESSETQMPATTTHEMKCGSVVNVCTDFLKRLRRISFSSRASTIGAGKMNR